MSHAPPRVIWLDRMHFHSRTNGLSAARKIELTQSSLCKTIEFMLFSSFNYYGMLPKLAIIEGKHKNNINTSGQCLTFPYLLDTRISHKLSSVSYSHLDLAKHTLCSRTVCRKEGCNFKCRNNAGRLLFSLQLRSNLLPTVVNQLLRKRHKMPVKYFAIQVQCCWEVHLADGGMHVC